MFVKKKQLYSLGLKVERDFGANGDRVRSHWVFFAIKI